MPTGNSFDFTIHPMDRDERFTMGEEYIGFLDADSVQLFCSMSKDRISFRFLVDGESGEASQDEVLVYNVETGFYVGSSEISSEEDGATMPRTLVAGTRKPHALKLGKHQ